jgi:hypothetical protein
MYMYISYVLLVGVNSTRPVREQSTNFRTGHPPLPGGCTPCPTHVPN